jgi:hypothetical protein
MHVMAPPKLLQKLREYYELTGSGKVDQTAKTDAKGYIQSDPAAAEERVNAYVEKIGMTFFRPDAGWHEEDWPSEPAEILAVGTSLAVLFRLRVAAQLSDTPAEAFGLKTAQDGDEMLVRMWERLVVAKNKVPES